MDEEGGWARTMLERTFGNCGDIGAIGILAAIFNFDDERAKEAGNTNEARLVTILRTHPSSCHHLLLLEPSPCVAIVWPCRSLNASSSHCVWAPQVDVLFEDCSYSPRSLSFAEVANVKTRSYTSHCPALPEDKANGRRIWNGCPKCSQLSCIICYSKERENRDYSKRQWIRLRKV